MYREGFNVNIFDIFWFVTFVAWVFLFIMWIISLVKRNIDNMYKYNLFMLITMVFLYIFNILAN